MIIKKLQLLTNDLNGTKIFYSQKLSFGILEESEVDASCKVGSTILTFLKTEIANPVYHFAFNISSNKIEEAADWCEAKGLELLPFPPDSRVIDFPNWNAKSIYFLDNNGNVLEFIARFDLPTESNKPFDKTQILSVSEIGIVTDKVYEFCNMVTEKYGIPSYEKQRPSPNFSVLGDAQGLLIVVPEKRNWFPTIIPSGKFPVDIALEQDEQIYSVRL